VADWVHDRGRGIEDELPDDLTILDEEHDLALAAAVRSLPPKRKLVLFLRYYADFSYGEIAEAVGIAEGTVAATLSQAHAALLNELLSKEVAPVVTEARSSARCPLQGNRGRRARRRLE
jgi:DNA-directed RNA polymerase specialized sigma24 family protein